MNNAAGGVILALGLVGMGLMFIAVIDGLDKGPDPQFTMKDLASALTASMGMLSCAIIAGAALAGMTPSQPRTVTFPGQPGAVPPQGQPYQAAPQPYAPPQQYGQQNPQQGSQ
ncbi:MAG: hypothetical protein FWJ90_15415 [Actinomadura sp.]